MTSSRILPVLATGVLALGLLAGCAPTPEPKPTKTAAFASDEEAFAAAEETYQDYIGALNNVKFEDPTTFTHAFELSRGELNASDREYLSSMHAESYSRTGSTVVGSFEGDSYAASEGTIHATTCIDVSDVDIVDEDGASVVSPDRPNAYRMAVVFEIDEDRILVTESSPTEDLDSCDA
ncbi:MULTISPECIES: hypothetical protein [unclassified Microbacterium]|uniref:hypothetical protein n=1 Tax=unclassified Microbacterium TaxID=2609290 RepID=UPI0012F8D07B|nr:hypothetical protein [Microbacterium sp. MAH-37]MVQ43291.1 hypothetical protein [Microbacterium sp. MAH-37]